MMGALEWSGWQQVLFLLECIPSGMILGLLFEITSIFVRFTAKKGNRYLFDALYSVLAAIITFFTALVTMDGQLHPLLFIGILLGFISEHLLLGEFIMKVTIYVERLVRKIGVFLKTVYQLFTRFLQTFGHRVSCFVRKNAKLYEKNS